MPSLESLDPALRQRLRETVLTELERRRRLKDERLACENSLTEFGRGAWGARQRRRRQRQRTAAENPAE